MSGIVNGLQAYSGPGGSSSGSSQIQNARGFVYNIGNPSAGGNTPGAGNTYATYITIDAPIKITKFWVVCVASVTGNLDIALYSPDGTTKLGSTGSLACVLNAGKPFAYAASGTINITVPDLYIIAVASSAGQNFGTLNGPANLCSKFASFPTPSSVTPPTDHSGLVGGVGLFLAVS